MASEIAFLKTRCHFEYCARMDVALPKSGVIERGIGGGYGGIFDPDFVRSFVGFT